MGAIVGMDDRKHVLKITDTTVNMYFEDVLKITDWKLYIALVMG